MAVVWQRWIFGLLGAYLHKSPRMLEESFGLFEYRYCPHLLLHASQLTGTHQISLSSRNYLIATKYNMVFSPPAWHYEHHRLPYSYYDTEIDDCEHCKSSIIGFIFILLFIVAAVCAVLMIVVHTEIKKTRKMSRRQLAILARNKEEAE